MLGRIWGKDGIRIPRKQRQVLEDNGANTLKRNLETTRTNK